MLAGWVLSLAAHTLLWAACALRGPSIDMDDRWTTPPRLDVSGGEITLTILPPTDPVTPPSPDHRPTYKPKQSDLPEPVTASASAPADAARATMSNTSTAKAVPVEPPPSDVSTEEPLSEMAARHRPTRQRPISQTSDSPANRPVLPSTPAADLPEVPHEPVESKADASTSVAASQIAKEGVRDATLTDPPSPRYPRQCVHRGQEGVVVLRVRVLADGSVGAVEIVKSSGVAPLDAEALRAMKRARFRPARRDGEPVVAWVTQPVRFALRS